jgi:hypothetical protein
MSRREFLKLTAAAVCCSALPFRPKTISAQVPERSELFWVTDIPDTLKGSYNPGIDGLLNLMGTHGLKFYKSPATETDTCGPLGMIAPDDVVLIKVNAQWKYRGCTNSDLVRGLIQRILDHPDGFSGEVVVIENGQGRGSLQCDTMGSDYPAGVHANAEDELHSFTYLVDTVFNDPTRVSYYLLDPIRAIMINPDDHDTDGYRIYENISYPCFTSRGRHRIEVQNGIWNGSGYKQGLKLINIPVLKHHDTGGSEITASLKHFYGLLSMADGQSGFRHYAGLGETCGKMVASVRTPILNIIDAIWVSHGSLGGYPKNTTTRLNQIIASQDPVALDYWAAKYILFPIKGYHRHHPAFPGIASWLTSAALTINDRGPLHNPDSGIFVSNVTNDESKMVTNRLAIAPSDIVFSPTEGTIGSEVTITGSDIPLTTGKIFIGGTVARILSWNNTGIKCHVNKVISAGPLHVTIQSRPYRTTSPTLLTSAFTVKVPEIDPLPIDHGSPGDEITVPGRFFSTKRGKVYIEYEKEGQPRWVMCPLKSWTMNRATGLSEIRFRVPKGIEAGTYPLRVVNKIGTGETTFTITISL